MVESRTLGFGVKWDALGEDHTTSIDARSAQRLAEKFRVYRKAGKILPRPNPLTLPTVSFLYRTTHKRPAQEKEKQ